jgi:flagellar biosynthesis component FlhA
MRFKILLFGPGVLLFLIGALTVFGGAAFSLPNMLLMALGAALAGVSFMHKRWAEPSHESKKKDATKLREKGESGDREEPQLAQTA